MTTSEVVFLRYDGAHDNAPPHHHRMSCSLHTMSETSDASMTDVDSFTNDATRPPPLSALFLIKFDQKVGCVYELQQASKPTDMLIKPAQVYYRVEAVDY